MKRLTIAAIIFCALLGSFLVVPAFAAGSSDYLVKSGDTLWGIATKFDTTVVTLLDMNPGITPDSLRVNQTVRIPVGVLSRVHVVEPRETLWGIAKLHEVTLEALLELNQLSHDSSLMIGQRLVVPLPGQPTAIQYIVKPGDSYWSLAAKHKTTVDYLFRLNGMLAPEHLQVNTMIRLPVSPAATQPRLHIVKSGDTLHRLARMYGTTVAQLIIWNSQIRPESLAVGQSLFVGN